jgi:hypothetical protein
MQVPLLRNVLHCSVVVVTLYGHLCAVRAELFLQRMLDGVNNASLLAQQVLCMSALRSLCLSPPTVHFLHTTCAFATFSLYWFRRWLFWSDRGTHQFIETWRERSRGHDGDETI